MAAGSGGALEGLQRTRSGFVSANSLASGRARKMTASCGLRLRVDDEGFACVVGIERGSAADLSGAVAEGDMLLLVDGKKIEAAALALEDGHLDVLGVEGSLVMLSMCRWVPGVREPLLYDVSLWFGTLAPHQCANCLDNYERAVREEEGLVFVEDQKVAMLHERLSIERTANKVLEERISATREKIQRAKISVERGEEERDRHGWPWSIEDIPLLGESLRNICSGSGKTNAGRNSWT